MEFIDIKKQYRLHKKKIDAAIQSVLESGQFIMGPQVAELEETLAADVGVEACVTVSSGTDSLLFALMALDIGPGDEVITVPFTWISSAEVIALVGATPVFVDIDPATYLIDVEAVAAAITPKTRAVIPVDLFGQMADYPALNAIADAHGIAVIADAAQSLGATQHGVASGAAALVTSTSFFPAKPFGCYGDGGALFTNDAVLAARLRAIRTHGGERRHRHTCLGTNGRLDTLQAAILLAKYPHFADEVVARSRLGAHYSARLEGLCTTPAIATGNSHIYAQYTIRVPHRDAVVAAIKEQGVPVAIYYPKCLHQQPVFSYLGYRYGDFPVAEAAAREVLSLPMHPWLTTEEQGQVVAAVAEAQSHVGERR